CATGSAGGHRVGDRRDGWRAGGPAEARCRAAGTTPGVVGGGFFFSSRRRHTRSVSAFLLNRSSDLRRRLRSFAASWLLNALLRIFAMSIITPKRKVLRMSVQDCWRPPL